MKFGFIQDAAIEHTIRMAHTSAAKAEPILILPQLMCMKDPLELRTITAKAARLSDGEKALSQLNFHLSQQGGCCQECTHYDPRDFVIKLFVKHMVD